MTHLDTSDGRQPVFELEEAFRERLEQLGQQQYSAGRAQNRTEVETWASTYHPLLMPVVAADADGYWLVMPRGVAVTDTSPEIEAWLDRAREALAGVVWSGDIDAGNAVRLDGELRLCDYGLSPA